MSDYDVVLIGVFAKTVYSFQRAIMRHVWLSFAVILGTKKALIIDLLLSN